MQGIRRGEWIPSLPGKETKIVLDFWNTYGMVAFMEHIVKVGCLKSKGPAVHVSTLLELCVPTVGLIFHYG